MNKPAYFLAIILTIFAFSISAYRVSKLGTSVLPKPIDDTWKIEAKISVSKSKRPYKVSIGIPSSKLGATILEESFRSQELAGLILEKDSQRNLIWSGRVKKKKSLTLSYTASMQKGIERKGIPKSILKTKPSTGELVTEVEAKRARNLVRMASRSTNNKTSRAELIVACINFGQCKDLKDGFSRIRKSEEQKALVISAILSDAGIPAVAARGIEASRAKLSTNLTHWVYAKLDGSWVALQLDSRVAPDDLIFWDFASLDRETPKNLKYSIVPIVNSYFDPGKVGAESSTNNGWKIFSLDSVPVSLQSVFQVMLLIPVGALVISLFRTIVGFPTFGTFMPILIALSFRETGLRWGLALLIGIIILGLLVRFTLSHLRLLLVPRLSATLSIVVILVMVICKTSFSTGFTEGLSITLFPIVIITMVIERLCITWEEVGASKALMLLCSSLVASIIAYLIMSLSIIQYWVFVFPEVLFFVLALTIIVGRFTGFRLTELYRFRKFITKADAS